MNCSTCRFHRAEGKTFFGVCTYFEQRGKEARDIEDSKIYDNGCHKHLKAMECFECKEEVTFDNSTLASSDAGDTDRCCEPCYEKIVQETINNVRRMGIVQV
jgi:hypothetical protein